MDMREVFSYQPGNVDLSLSENVQRVGEGSLLSHELCTFAASNSPANKYHVNYYMFNM